MAIALVGWTFSRWGSPPLAEVAFFWLVHLLACWSQVEVPVRRLSLVADERPRGPKLSPGFVVLLTIAFIGNPSVAVAVAFLPALPLLRSGQRDLLKTLFNSAQEALYVGAAAVAFLAVRSFGDGVYWLFVGAAAAAIVEVLMNHILVVGVVALEQKMAWHEIARGMMWTVPHSLAFALVALMVASLYGQFGFLSVAFLFMPIVSLRIVRQAKLELDVQTRETIVQFARRVEEKDPHTRRHSERVAEIVVALHRALGTPTDRIEHRWYAALLHDVGKVAVPSRILSKPGALTRDEYAAIMKHPEIGAETVGQIGVFADLCPEIRYHHERMDGHGYPERLAGAEIPFDARVLAVADAFEALTSDRPYRRRMSFQDAFSELSRTAGDQHDPGVIRVLAQLIDSGEILDRSNSVRSVTSARAKLVAAG